MSVVWVMNMATFLLRAVKRFKPYLMAKDLFMNNILDKGLHKQYDLDIKALKEIKAGDGLGVA